MGRRWLLTLPMLLGTWPLWPQAVTQGRTSQGLPWAVVELPGGDSEVVAAWVTGDLEQGPPGWEPSGWTGGLAFVASAPALQAPLLLAERLQVLPASRAVVFLGPVPARELSACLHHLEAVPYAPPPRAPCGTVDGSVTFHRREVEGFRLSFPLPPPWDPRFELAPAAAFVLDRRFRQLGFSGPVRVEREVCPQLTLEHLGDKPYQAFNLARASRQHLAAPVAEGELAPFFLLQRREVNGWAVNPREFAVKVVERLGWGRPLGPAFLPLTPAPAAVEELLRQSLLAYIGQGEVWQRERRGSFHEVATLANGAVLVLREIPAEVGILAVGFGGVESEAARGLATQLAVLASQQGLPSQVAAGVGTAAVGVVGSSEELVEILESLVAQVTGWRGTTTGRARSRALAACGLEGVVRGENVAVALELPEGGEELGEAAEKFLASLPAGEVRRLPSLQAGLWWQEAGGPAEVVAVVELPGDLAGLVAAQALSQRLQAQGAEVNVQSLAGFLLLVFGLAGGGTVQSQDEALAGVWDTARMVTAEDVRQAWERLTQQFFGSAAQGVMRRALAVFLPPLASTVWRAPEASAVRQLVNSLPGYKALARFGFGPAEQGRGARRS
ncbi:MAG: hypothetical protein N2447_00550 [Thermoanaerobaculum sp.]|nr:hypothetical protein [Thermoanaerobaculum sp.]